jgi:hypothetical protein
MAAPVNVTFDSVHTRALLSAISTAVTSYDNPSPAGPAPAQVSARIVGQESSACVSLLAGVRFIADVKLRILFAAARNEARNLYPSLQLSDSNGLTAA